MVSMEMDPWFPWRWTHGFHGDGPMVVIGSRSVCDIYVIPKVLFAN